MSTLQYRIEQLRDKLALAVSALEKMYRCGQKQGWNDSYATEMGATKNALDKLKGTSVPPERSEEEKV